MVFIDCSGHMADGNSARISYELICDIFCSYWVVAGVRRAWRGLYVCVVHVVVDYSYKLIKAYCISEGG